MPMPVASQEGDLSSRWKSTDLNWGTGEPPWLMYWSKIRYSHYGPKLTVSGLTSLLITKRFIGSMLMQLDFSDNSHECKVLKVIQSTSTNNTNEN